MVRVLARLRLAFLEVERVGASERVVHCESRTISSSLSWTKSNSPALIFSELLIVQPLLSGSRPAVGVSLRPSSPRRQTKRTL